MNNEFKIIKKIKEYILFLESILINYPKKDFIAKNMVYETGIDIMYFILKANYSKDILERKECQKEILVLIHMLDFYLERGYKNKYISEGQLKKSSNKLTELTKMVCGWIKSERVY